jgi:hypothetical protein
MRHGSDGCGGAQDGSHRDRQGQVTAGKDNAGVRVVLADGRVGLLRPLGPDDQVAVLRLHESLDERDRYFRFFGPLPPRNE